MQESRFLHFIKELPDRYLLIGCFLILLVFYNYIRTDAVLQLMINFGVAIIALSTKSAPKTPSSQNVENADTVIQQPADATEQGEENK